MNQRTLLLEVNPQSFYGEQNSNIELLRSYFPKIRIVARGNEIHIFGEEAILDEFERRVEQLTLHLEKYNHLDRNVIERILTSDHGTLLPSTLLDKDFIVHGVKGKIIRAQTPNQQKLLELIGKNDMVFAIGPAGTGKTYTSVALAVRALKDKQVRRIILTRPAVEAGENLGFLPGDLKDKLDPYMQPLYDALMDMIPIDKLNNFIENGTIQIAPLAFMRGRTLDNAFVILDEAQNTTYVQMKMFLTRMGRNAKFIITGDPGQVDLPKKVKSGLSEALHIIKGIKGIGTLFLDDKDVVRHPLVKEIINAYSRAEKEED
ncbi:PhoH family protein [Capnocytophaga gingivalis]